MSWTDKKAIKQFCKLRDEFNIDRYVETGTHKGIGAAVHAANFSEVLTIENDQKWFDISHERLAMYDNVEQKLCDSQVVLKNLANEYKTMPGNEYTFFYLDAHFYDPQALPEDRFVVLKELRALAGHHRCVIAIHDFDCNGLGHIVYDGQSLNFNLLKEWLYAVNPNFNYYCNTRELCDIMTVQRITDGEVPNLNPDPEVLDAMQYVWSLPEKTYRGILYAVPKKLDLNVFELVEFSDTL